MYLSILFYFCIYIFHFTFLYFFTFFSISSITTVLHLYIFGWKYLTLYIFKCECHFTVCWYYYPAPGFVYSRGNILFFLFLVNFSKNHQFCRIIRRNNVFFYFPEYLSFIPVSWSNRVGRRNRRWRFWVSVFPSNRISFISAANLMRDFSKTVAMGCDADGRIARGLNLNRIPFISVSPPKLDFAWW